MNKVSGSVFDTTTLPKFLGAKEMAEALRTSYNVPITETYLREIAISGHCPAFFFEGDLKEPLFVKRDVVNWMRETAFYQTKTKPSLEVVVNPHTEAVDALSLPDALRQVEGLLEHRMCEDPCVYFLIQRNKVVYVGQTICLANRAKQHTDKKFDRVVFLPVPKSQMLKVEGDFIRLLQPRYNAAGTISK